MIDKIRVCSTGVVHSSYKREVGSSSLPSPTAIGAPVLNVRPVLRKP